LLAPTVGVVEEVEVAKIRDRLMVLREEVVL
jgi:hypothetical protein